IVGLFITVYGLREEGRLSNSLSAISSVGRGWRSQQTEETEIGRAANETLGFEKIIVVGLQERSDRRDAIVLQSSLTGFHVEFMDGIKGADVSSKALPMV
ncbi:hypothetical protein DH86_00002136, partial [Scytalidium sp. 3C]